LGFERERRRGRTGSQRAHLESGSMVESETTLQEFLPGVHQILNDESVEKDLICIKRIKKICADTKHIVANRELEIKDVVRALQSKVEDQERQVENDSAVKECLGKLEAAEGRRQQLVAKLEALGNEKEASLADIAEIRREAEQLKMRRNEVEKDMAEHIPVQKGLLALYVNITNLRFDYDAANVKGIVVPPEGEEDIDPRPFDLDPSSLSEFELTNRLWDLID